MIFYVLQSAQFTRVPRIEPALSAKEYAEGGRIPKAALDRMGDFLRAVRRPAGNPRLAYFRTLRPTYDLLRREYERAMPPLYRKEFQGGADFYRERGLSTDTSIEACYAVHVGLGVLKELRPGARINRVLIVGPGLDLAPRTGFNDAYPPQSFEPFAVADSLLALGLADSARLAIDCVDINPRVVAWFRAVPSGIHLYLSGAGYTPEFDAWYATFGAHIGTRKGGEIRLRPLHLYATCLDIIAARRDTRYERSVATNVFPYFDGAQLSRSLAHLKAMLAP